MNAPGVDWQERVGAVSDVLRRHRETAETQRALHPESVAAMGDAGLLRLWLPRSLGGYELDPVSYTEVAESVARIDAAAAWLMMVTANTTFDLRWADEQLVDEMFGGGGTVIVCETFNKTMTACPDGDGYRVSGRSGFASGCVHADWQGHTARDGDDLLLMFHPRGALTIEDDWDSLGLRGTASNSISADDLFVPGHRVIRFGPDVSANRWYRSHLYQLPEAILTTTFAPVALGVLRGALDSADEIAASRIPFARDRTLRHQGLPQLHYGRALGTYRAARSLMRETLHAAWRRAAGTWMLRDKADLFLQCAFALQSSEAAVRELARAVGTSAVYRGVIERALRDSQVIARHAFGAEARFASVAQAYWDVDVDFPLMAMD